MGRETRKGRPSMSEERKNDEGQRNADTAPVTAAAETDQVAGQASEQGGEAAQPDTGDGSVAEGKKAKGKKKRGGKSPKQPPDGEREGAVTETAPPPASTRPQGGRGAWFVAVLALLLTLGLAAGGGWFWLQDQQRAQRLESRLAELERGLEQRLEAFASRDELQALAQRLEGLSDLEGRVEQRLNDIAARQQASEERLKAAMDRLYQRMGRSSVDWILAEAEYLLRLANERLLLAHDPDTALAALRAADSRLAAIDDPALQSVRAAIAREVAALEGVPRLDLAGLAARVDALAGRMEELPLARRYLPPEPLQAPAAGLEERPLGEGPWWEQAWNRVKETLQSLVVVRYNEQPVAPLLAPDQVAALRQALMLELEVARAALVRGDQPLFRAALERASKLVNRYFEAESPATQAVVAALQELAAMEITVTYPDLSESLRLLRAVKAEVGAGDVVEEAGS